MALGIGLALASGQAVALAETSDATSSDSAGAPSGDKPGTATGDRPSTVTAEKSAKSKKSEKSDSDGSSTDSSDTQHDTGHPEAGKGAGADQDAPDQDAPDQDAAPSTTVPSTTAPPTTKPKSGTKSDQSETASEAPNRAPDSAASQTTGTGHRSSRQAEPAEPTGPAQSTPAPTAGQQTAAEPTGATTLTVSETHTETRTRTEPAAEAVALTSRVGAAQETASAPPKNPVATIVLAVLSFLGWTPRPETAAAFPTVPTPWAVVAWLRDAHPWYNRPPSAVVVTGPPDPTGDTAIGQVVGTDADSDDLTYAVDRGPRYGTVTLDAVSGHFIYTPTDLTAPADSFAVAVDDGHRAGTTVVVVTVDLADVPTARKVEVTSARSELTLPCGDGCTVPANWYFPDSDEPPNGVIWLQHGFIAGGGWYDELAVALAAQTNSIVVAPTLSSNPLTSGGKWLNGEVMQQAVADLLADRGALSASAVAAGYTGALPQRMVLTGHSAGGGLVATVAGDAVDNGAITDIVGVVMFDGVPVGDAVTAALAKLTGVNDRPVYQIAAHPYVWNSNGAGTAQLVDARPDRFVGVLLNNSSHIDSMQASDPLIGLAGNLFAGYARAENKLAVQTLAVGWINDMYFGTVDGIYGAGGSAVQIGDASGVVLGTAAAPTPISAVAAATAV